MASSSKQKTTWSKIQRESAKREKRAEKAARKEARRNAPAEPDPSQQVLAEQEPGAELELEEQEHEHEQESVEAG